jgi:oxygen-dependent protoporphyrinogen oxidase
VWCLARIGCRANIQLSLDSETISTSHVISSLAPPNLAPLVSDIRFPDSPRTSVGVVSLVFPVPPSQIHPEGFGYLIPRPSDPRTNPSGILGVVFDSTALPGLDTIDGVTKLTIMMGGPYWSSYQPTLPRPANADDLVPLALEHVRSVFPATRDLEPALVLRSLHKDCIPTYTSGHAARAKALQQEIAGSKWNGRLSLVGNAFAGVGVNDCVWSAERMVDALAEGRSVTGLEAWA